MFPGTEGEGFTHSFSAGLHLVAGVNGLGKSTLLLMLYHGLVGPVAIENDNFGIPQPKVVRTRMHERFRRRVADNAEDASVTISFSLGRDIYTVTRSLYDLSLTEWDINGVLQTTDEDEYSHAITKAMNVGGYADVLIILNLIVFMFEDRGLLMWSPLAQRNVLRALFMPPSEANTLSERAQLVATSNGAYRRYLYQYNKDERKLGRDRKALVTGDALSAEYNTLRQSLTALNQRLDEIYQARTEADDARTEARYSLESAKLNFDELLREVEALKLSRVATAFPSATEAGRYVVARIIGDKECLSCGANDGPLVDRWVSAVAEGECLVCGAPPADQEVIVPAEATDTARIDRAEKKLAVARQFLASSRNEYKSKITNYDHLQEIIDKLLREKLDTENRIKQIAGSLPPSPPEIQELEQRVRLQEKTLRELDREQKDAEYSFGLVFDDFKNSINRQAARIREKFISRISDFLVEDAEITLTTTRDSIGESGQRYDWPSFQLSMTSGTFNNPSPRQNRSEVSMSQGEFIDLAFRLALIEAAAEDSGASLIVDAPEASLDALFMRRAGTFLARFTEDNEENRLIVTSNLTNADMIPALFGAYDPEQGDPQPITVPRSERRERVINLLELAAPTSAIELVGDRYKNLLNSALFPPSGEDVAGL